MKITGAKAHAARLKRMAGPEAVALVGQALFAGADMITTDAQISITNGAVSGKFHVPSLPGEPPNQNTGHLANNIETLQPAPLKAQSASNAEYSRPLEFGTSKMAERPFMRPATAKNRKAIVDLVRKAVNKATSGSN